MTKSEYIEKCRKELEVKLKAKGHTDAYIKDRIFVPKELEKMDETTIKEFFDELCERDKPINIVR